MLTKSPPSSPDQYHTISSRPFYQSEKKIVEVERLIVLSAKDSSDDLVSGEGRSH